MVLTKTFLLSLTALVSIGHAFIPTASSWCRLPTRASRLGQVRIKASIADVIEDAESRMKKSIDSVQSNLNTLRTGRASPALLDRVQVEYYGTPTSLNQLAGISVQGGQSLMIDPYDKSAIGDIERAIMESDLGITPSNTGDAIRLNIPPLTEDRRKELVKNAKSLGEDGKVAIRNVRRDAVDTIKKMAKEQELSEDNVKDGQDSVQKITDKYIKAVDETVKTKETDIMKV